MSYDLESKGLEKGRVSLGAGQSRDLLRPRAVMVVWLILMSLGGPAQGQLAITEVMSGTHTVTNAFPDKMPDYWELTNFGDEEISLHGYRWVDSDRFGLDGADDVPFQGLSILPHETILFVQDDVQQPISDPLIRDWWGEGLPAATRIVRYFRNGLSQAGDEVHLWDDSKQQVDWVRFGQGIVGRSFTYSPDTGEFGRFSEEGVDGAVRAAVRRDVGSPGSHTGPVPLQILTQPMSQTVCAGREVAFAVRAGGMPRPRYQWSFHGTNLPGANAASLIITNPQPSDAGEYQVKVSNFFGQLQSQVATLTIDDTPRPPIPFQPMEDVRVFENATARFAASVCAFPPATYQWFSNGVALAQATNRVLEIANAQPSSTERTICVSIMNSLGSTNLCARLQVSPLPTLLITEVMPAPSTNTLDTTDWFEVTNLGAHEVNLHGFRFASGNGMSATLAGAQQVTNEVAILRPGRSAIFVERLTRRQFLDWWGQDALPMDLLVITFHSEGLSGVGDELYLWRPDLDDPDEFMASVVWAVATSNVSKYFLSNGFDAIDYDSVLGERGVFEAARGGDIGSPGYSPYSPLLVVGIKRDASEVTLTFFAEVGRSYQLLWAPQPDREWQLVTTVLAENWVESVSHATGDQDGQGFYRLKEIP